MILSQEVGKDNDQNIPWRVSSHKIAFYIAKVRHATPKASVKDFPLFY